MNALKQGFLLCRQSRDINNQTQITLWLKSDEHAFKLEIPHQELIFFIKHDDADRVNSMLSGIPHNVRQLPLKDFELDLVDGYYFSHYSVFQEAVNIIKHANIEIWESDIRVADRFLMERFCHAGIEFTGDFTQKQGYTLVDNAQIRPSDFSTKLSTISLDIECDMDGSLFSVGLQNTHYKTVIMIGDTQEGPDWIIWVKNEAQLLKAMVNEIITQDPDLIIGWNVVNFDFRVLNQAAKRNGVRLAIGRDGSTAYFRESKREHNAGFINIAGRVVVDGIDGLKTATYQFESFSLENVARELLSEGKKVDNVNDRMQEIRHNFHHEKIKLAEYNLQDCELVTRIFDHTNLIEFLQLRSQLTGLELDRIGGSVAAFTHLYLPKLHRAGFVAPNLPADGGLASPGGYVMSSIPGFYSNVLVLDFKSLYPSIIRTFKIDPMGLIIGLEQPDIAIEGFKGAMFSRQQHFLPGIIQDLWQQRDQAKKDKDLPRSQAIKILMNSFYGVLGSGGCRFYDTRLASSITMRGHQIMQQTAKWIEEAGFKVIYGDTDSTFVLLDEELDAEQSRKIGMQLQDEINIKWHELLRAEFDIDCELELEFETHYSRFLMPTIRGSEVGSKKRYAGLIINGKDEKLVFKGLETVRTDWTELARGFQLELYRRVFHDLDVCEYIINTVEQTMTGRRDELLIYKKRLRQPLAMYVKNVPPHVKAARIADQHNLALGRPLQYQQKGAIAYVITLNGPEPVDYLSSPIDYEHYIEKQIKPIADGILPFIGLSFDELTNQQMPLF